MVTVLGRCSFDRLHLYVGPLVELGDWMCVVDEVCWIALLPTSSMDMQRYVLVRQLYTISRIIPPIENEYTITTANPNPTVTNKKELASIIVSSQGLGLV